jgi:hypothetical protein
MKQQLLVVWEFVGQLFEPYVCVRICCVTGW